MARVGRRGRRHPAGPLREGRQISRRVAIVIGAAGFLGAHLCRSLARAGAELRVLVQPTDGLAGLDGLRLMAVQGDVRSAADLDALFAGVADGADVTVYHLASRITIESRVTPSVREVNVEGTREVSGACLRNGARRLVYVSSVHAIPEPDPGTGEDGGELVIVEPDHFDPELVVGGYAKTKAEATQLVLDANGATVGKHGGALETVVVMPSGIVGPGDVGGGYLTALVRDLAKGSLTSYVDGGSDFVDVRDVADGIIAAGTDGVPGRPYTLTARRMEVDEIVRVSRAARGRRTLKSVLPMWFARTVAPIAEAAYKMVRKPPIFTPYALHTLAAEGRFSTEAARRDLGWDPRAPADSLRDMVHWLDGRGELKRRR